MTTREITSVRAKPTWIGRATWLFLASVAVIYGPMAIEYMWNFFGVKSPTLWLDAYSSVVGHEQATGAGSIATDSHAPYVHSRVAMLIHTTAGGLVILMAIAQFNRRLRTKHPRVHRWTGRAQVSLVVTAMLGAMTYLVRTGPDRTYDGPAFYMQLWFLGGATLASSVLAVLAIRAKQVQWHQCLMAYNFALLLTAPLLRVEYMVLGAGHTTTQAITNLQGGLLLGFAAPSGAIAASRYFDRRAKLPARVRPLPGAHLDLVAWPAGALGIAAAVALYAHWIGRVDRLSPALIIGYAVTLIAFTLTERRARRQGNTVAERDWRIHRLAVLATPALLVVMWLVYRIPFADQPAFYAAGLTAPPTALTLGFLTALWSRRVVRTDRSAGGRDLNYALSGSTPHGS